ncbi:ribosomal protein L21 [Hoylesella loescheii DSM 19665 = JCM 12249 = ATCC 15930]|uniref:Large ribosomal subunit protein bL21 n=2 Tax=Hoylesella TaxID=2974257 RepID=A0A069QJI0_HOYLO|nr:ribosomal protein L21 [Prevotella sp. oral taxon 472 str. F0295]KDR52985.1 ribosomal protein L21 [Hoylesella loescheii DSM 19665 = JCM 12249 = ATCC 15930]
MKHPNIFRNFAPVLVRGGLKKCRNESERLAENRFTNIIMYAIVEINGQQFKVEQGMKLYVHHIKDVEAGKTVEFDKVLLVDKEGAVTVGAPTVEGAKVVVEVVNPLVKGDKVIVFKMKRRKDYRKKNGHRAQFTQVEVKQVIA